MPDTEIWGKALQDLNKWKRGVLKLQRMLSKSELRTGAHYQRGDILPATVTGSILATVPMYWHVHWNDRVVGYQVEVLDDGLQIHQ